ncbi:DUF2339 domain-containing protein [Pseudomonas abieticivorans]|uniref:DUF2339 domain-containing protein n=1 Tax=Pseudomonas abieticivorans TaxID=2931382 RepID=UPI0020C05897|nr:DUF2339 domain-containing protein [Pseudomonas sp. PIA16]
MQWLFMLLGLVLGGAFDESIEGALVGAVLGLALGLSIRLGALARTSREHARQLAQTREALAALQARVALLDPAIVAPTVATRPPVETQPDLVWELPDTEPPQPDAWSREPITPGEPNFIEKAVAGARAWLLGGNTVLRIGVVLLFLGLAFLLRYATENVVVPIELRYAGVAACALLLLGLGWRLRERKRQYGLLLQGAGVAVLYLTVFAAMRLHSLIDPGPAMALLVAVTVFSAMLAVMQDALGLAAAAALGGFAAPILASTGAGSHVALFSYFALLNAGILSIAWFKAWRLLNLIGFVGTFGIGFTWGLRSYTPELFASTEPFLLLFFFMYLAIGLLFARRSLLDTPEPSAQPAWRNRANYVHGSILFGPPLVGFGLQYALVRHLEFGPAFSALGLGVIYMGVAWLLARRVPERAALLLEACLALGVIFASLAIPLGLGAHWTTAAWAVEGAGLVWLGVRQGRRLACAFALLLQAGAAVCFFQGAAPLQGEPLTALLVGLAALFSAWQLHVGRDQGFAGWARLSIALLVWGALWWLFAWQSVLVRWVPYPLHVARQLSILAVSAALAAWLAPRLRWSALAHLSLALIPLAGLALLLEWDDHAHPLGQFGWLAWALVFVAHFWSLRRLPAWLYAKALSGAHVVGCWLLIGVLALELRYALLQLADVYNAWRWLGWALLPSLYLLAMASPRAWPWPVSEQPQAYRWWAALPLAVAMLGWYWLANVFSDGDAQPLPYVPLINPLELGLLFVLFGIHSWSRSTAADAVLHAAHLRGPVQWLLGASLFALITATVMRTAHHWAGVPYALDWLLGSMLVQAALSLVWTLIALGLMIGGHLRHRREVWLVGAVLIAVVVAKLVFVELSNHGGLSRIVSFIGVGVLLLVVGYFAPLPPRRNESGVHS